MEWIIANSVSISAEFAKPLLLPELLTKLEVGKKRLLVFSRQSITVCGIINAQKKSLMEIASRDVSFAAKFP